MQTEQPEATEGEVNPVPEVKGACFLNQDRVCGADCMAFLPTAPQGVAYIGQQWAHCLLLVNAERTGKHLIVLADIGNKLVASKRQEEREKKAPGV